MRTSQGATPREPAVAELQTLSGKHLLPSFGDDENEHEEAIAETVQEISSLFKACEHRMQEVASSKHAGAGDEVRWPRLNRTAACTAIACCCSMAASC